MANRLGLSIMVGVLWAKALLLNQLLLSPSLCVGGGVFSFRSLDDSRAQDNLLDDNLAAQIGCSLEILPIPITATGLVERIIARVMNRKVPVTLIFSGNHFEIVGFFLVLSYSWLHLHNLHIGLSLTSQPRSINHASTVP